MDARIGPAQARELAAEMRNNREAMEVSEHVLAGLLGWSVSKLTRVEHGLEPVSEIDVVRHTANCGGTTEMIEGMLDLCRDPGAPDYWLCCCA
ncbi:helix-turn-helix domain-containing protein [Actinophytocola sediminis]